MRAPSHPQPQLVFPAEFEATGNWLQPQSNRVHFPSCKEPPRPFLQQQQNPNWLMHDSESSTACDNEEIKYGPFSDGEADKCHYRRAVRSRSLPRRPASSLMPASSNMAMGVPHYVTLSRAALVEAGDARMIEQHSLQYRSANGGHHQHHHHSLHPKTSVRYSSQPQLNADFRHHRSGLQGSLQQGSILDFHYPTPPVRKPKASGPKKAHQNMTPPPKYQQPVSQQESLENSEYLFPDLPPPPDALLDNTTTSASPPSIQQNSRCSSLDDLNWVTSAAEMSRSFQEPGTTLGFHMPNRQQLQKSNTLPSQPSRPQTQQQPISIMKKRASNPIELRRSSGAVKVDLSSADKTIRRPGSEPDLKTSPVRSSMRPQSQEVKRLSGISQGSSKKVMFSGLANNSDNESSTADHADDVWVLRCEDRPTGLASNSVNLHENVLNLDDDDVPVTGVVIAQPQPCKFVLAQQQFLKAQQQAAVAAANAQHAGAPVPAPASAVSSTSGQILMPAASNSPNKKLIKATPPPPPPRTTPVNPSNSVQASGPGNIAPAAGNGGAISNNRPANPVLQRPVQQHGQFHESPDEGYHEDDNGSEVL